MPRSARQDSRGGCPHRDIKTPPSRFRPFWEALALWLVFLRCIH